MGNIIIIAILVCIISSIIYYLYKEKKRGKTCIGCPYGGQCNSSSRKSGCCVEHKEEKKQ